MLLNPWALAIAPWSHDDWTSIKASSTGLNSVMRKELSTSVWFCANFKFWSKNQYGCGIFILVGQSLLTGWLINTKKYHVFAPMERFQLELIYLYFPPSSIHILDGTTVENKGKLILSGWLIPSTIWHVKWSQQIPGKAWHS